MRTNMKNRVFNLIPPAMIAMVLAFWAFGPKALVGHPLALAVTSPLIVIAVLLLELVSERHAVWRMNKREFFDVLMNNLTGTDEQFALPGGDDWD